jgi:copper chaperone
MEKIKLNVEGMSCQHCVAAVKGAVSELDGVKNVEVSLEAKTAEVEYDKTKASLEQIKKQIEEQGFDVV